jgi:hypothetical protein
MLSTASLAIGYLRACVRPLMRAARATRLIFFPIRAWRLYVLNRLGSFLHVDPWMFIKREHYLSRFFGIRQRIDNALSHYQHELDNYDETYRRLVYRDDNGLLLYEDEVNGARLSLRLVATGSYRCEGDVTVVVDVNGQDAGYLSYSFVDATCFGLPSAKMLFLTRSQLMPGRELFRRCYPNNSPQYFGLAAITGIAMANGCESIAVIKGEAQICYQTQYEQSFRNSYCGFWRQFDARTIDHQAYVLTAPLTLPPLSGVSSKHRARAIERRRHWANITQRTETAIRAHRRHAVRTSAGPVAWLYSCGYLISVDLLTAFAGLL